MALLKKTNNSVLEAVEGKFEQLLDERRSLLVSLSTNTAAINQAIGAAHLFGGNLEIPSDLAPNLITLTAEENRAATAPAQQSLFEAPAGEQTIREAVIDHLK